MQIAAIQKTTLVDFPGKVACIIFTSGCNFRCPFCHNPETVLPELIKKQQHDNIPEDVFFNFLKKRVNVLDGVVICGWEPTLQTDLVDFIKRIKQFKLLVKLDTNGQNPIVLKQLLDENLLDYIAVDIKAPLSNYSSLVWLNITEKFTNDYKQTLDIIKNNAKKTWLNYEYRTTVIKWYHNSEDIETMTNFIAGVPKYVIQNYRSEKTLDPNFDGQSFLEEELKNFQEIAKRTIDICEIRV